MGCVQSKNQGNNVFTLCNERKEYMMKAIASWEAFSAAFSAYSSALKNVGAALSDYSQGIVECIHHQPSKNRSSIYLGETPVITTPHFMCSPILENVDEENDEETLDAAEEGETTPLVESHQKQLLLQNQDDESQTKETNDMKVVETIVNELDRHFLEASECANQVKEMFQAQYDAGIDYADRVMSAITWNSSTGGTILLDDCEVHASILQWENRLYNELEAFEPVKSQYQSRVASLNTIQKRRSVKAKARDKARAAVNHFRSRYVVGRESIDSGIQQITRLRDELLYRRLVNHIDEMAKMWDSMHVHHDIQVQIVADGLKGELDTILGPILVNEDHRKRTELLWQSLRDWKLQHEELVKHQKEYVEALDGWLGLNLENFDSSLEDQENVSSTPIKGLIEAWKDELEMVPYDVGSRAIDSFSEVVRMIMVHQQDEMKLRKKCEEMQKDCVVKETSRESSKRYKLEKELESYKKINEILGEISVRSLTTNLEEVFHSMSEFCLASSEMYKKLSPI